MENKINIAELLRYCPTGMELDCTMYENVTFNEVITARGFDDKKRVKIILSTHYSDGTKDEIILTKFGTYTDDETAKCVIFPKGKTTWEGFIPPYQFKDGDIVYAIDEGNEYIFILKHIFDNGRVYCYLSLKNNDLRRQEVWLTDYNATHRLATKEEKERLFKAIENDGYKWNENTKSLEKINKPNFKNGDVLESGIGNLVLFSHTKNSFGKDIVYFHCILTPLGKLEIGENCGVGGTENCTLASDKQKERLFKALNEAGYNWDAETKTLIHNNEDYFKITLKLFKQLPSQQIEGVKTEDIPNKIAEILSKALKKKIEVKGDGIKADINIKIDNI